MVDALASGASVCMDVEVRVLSWAPFNPTIYIIINKLTDFWIFLPTQLSTLGIEFLADTCSE